MVPMVAGPGHAPRCSRLLTVPALPYRTPVRRALSGIGPQPCLAHRHTVPHRRVCCLAASSTDTALEQGRADVMRTERQAKDSLYGYTPQQLQKLADLPHEQFFHTDLVQSAEQLAKELNTSLDSGLMTDPQEFERRAEALGANRLPEKKQVSFWELCWQALQDFTVLILLAAGIISIVLEGIVDTGNENGWIEGAAILLAVAVVVLVTAVNDYQKERQFRELNAITEDAKVTVLRDGETQQISIYQLLVGDVMLVETGDILAADGLLYGGNDIKVDESHLTGEAAEVAKDPQEDPMIYSGSKILEGNGRLLVTAVGLNSQQGVISGLVQGVDDDGLRETTVLEEKLERLASLIGQFGLAAGLFSFATMSSTFSWQHFVVEGQPWDWSLASDYLHFLITAITILVVAVPEGLPLAVTIALAYSVKRMLADNNLVRHLGAAETMGTATTICTDKTGTLTQNDMTVVRLWLGGADRKAVHRTPQRGKVVAANSSDNSSGPGTGSSLHLGGIQPEAEPPLGLNAEALDLLVTGIAVNSNANLRLSSSPSGELLKIGSRTECALLELSLRLGGDNEAIRASTRVARVVPFSSDRKRMSTILHDSSPDGAPRLRCFSKGAAEMVLGQCSTRMAEEGGTVPLGEEQRQDLLRSFGADGHRMLALAYRDLPDEAVLDSEFRPEQVEHDMTLIAVVGIEDPIRPQVPNAIKQCQRAGITVRMLTGDNATTGTAIAKQAGILTPSSHPIVGLPQEMLEQLEASSSSGSSAGTAASTAVAGNGQPEQARLAGQVSDAGEASSSGSGDGALRHGVLPGDRALVLDGQQFRDAVLASDGSINQAAFNTIWPRLRVLARCSPKDKYTIVRALKASEGEIVAMTGDGTNDAPALRNADVGFAMMAGTSIAKDASDILLMDNNFNSIVSAVKWGRNVYAGITKFLQFQLTVNIVAVLTACVGALAKQESPLTAVQMLWVNLIMDSLASLSLATESPTEAMLDLPPYNAKQSLLTPTVTKNIVSQSVFQLGVMAALVFYGDQIFHVPSASSISGASEHYTLVFNAFVMMQLFNQVNTRKIYDEPNVLTGVLDNKIFATILLAEFVLQVAIVQFGGPWFQTHPLSLPQWGACIGIGALGLLVRAAMRAVPTANMSKQRADS